MRGAVRSRILAVDDQTKPSIADEATVLSGSEEQTVLSGSEEQTVLLGGDDPTVLSNGDAATVISAWSDSGVPSGDGPRLEPGQTFGPYTIGRLLGRGGMGEVYEANHVETGRRVALKVLRGRINRAEDRARFLSEGQLAASVSHPHTVYIFGSEEIGGMPVISMQLLTGGTLKDRVLERGPMAPTDAVSAVLDVIAGLDAAQSAGILHRDIKPSNCFIDTEGNVKVGDFGLSISTGAREVGESRRGFQGTPQYAPPEQLRGEHLDVRADIYAVGATLFYLLTGRAPFDARDFSELMDQVKTSPPPLAHKLRPGIPPALGAVTARCLAKDASGRPASYSDLARLLRPFSGTALPARRGLRLVAGVIDTVILALPIALFNAGSIRIGGKNFSADVNMDPWAFALNVLYFAVSEGWWQATIGKRICGLRVVSTSGELTWRQAALRALIFYGPGLPLVLLGLIFNHDRLANYLSDHAALGVLASMGPVVATVLMFVTMTRRNGLAAVHDLLTETRVVQRTSRDLRRSASADAAATAAAGSAHTATVGRRRFGSFDVTGELGLIPDGRLLAGVDVVLKRRVWLIERAAGAAEVPRARRDADRVGRLHWLAGQRSPHDNWDAFEAPQGAPVDPTPGASGWRDVQGWLNDLSAELAAAERDGTMPALSLDRVWIRQDGRAVLLDFPVRTSPHPPAPDAPVPFLVSVARLSLGNTTSSPMPVSAVAMVDRWARDTKKRGVSMADVAADLATVSLSVEKVSRGRRLIPVAMTVLPVLLMLGTSVIAIRTVGKVLSRDTFRMLALLTEREKDPDPTVRQAIDTYLAGTMHAALVDEGTWKVLSDNQKDKSDQELARLRQIARDAARLQPAAAETDAAAARIRATLDRVEGTYQKQVDDKGFRKTETIVIALLLVGCGMSFFGGLVSVLIRPSGVVLAALGLAVLTRRGREISRLRAVARLVIAWSPMLLFAIVLASSRTRALMLATGSTLAVAGLATVVMAVGTLWTILRPLRGPHDIAARSTIGVR
jgi:eukaryotic-like serine/threonine-protein kinase